jgi:hypothetical protein
METGLRGIIAASPQGKRRGVQEKNRPRRKEPPKKKAERRSAPPKKEGGSRGGPEPPCRLADPGGSDGEQGGWGA